MQDWKNFTVLQIRAERNYTVKHKSVERRKRYWLFSARKSLTQQNACIIQNKGKTPTENSLTQYIGPIMDFLSVEVIQL